MEPIRILIDSTTMDRGGAETLIMNIYRCIDRLRVQFDFILHCDYKSAYEEEISSLGGRIFKLPKYRLYNGISFRKALRYFFRTHPEYRIIHCHAMNSAPVVLDEANRCGLHTIAHSHATTNGHGPQAWIRDFSRRNLYRIAEYRFACSEEAGKWLYREKASFSIVANGIDTEKYAFNPEERNQQRKSLNIKPETSVIGTVGRLSGEKNHLFLLDIFSVFHTKHPDSILLIVGDGPLFSQLQKKAINLGVEDSVIFTGSRPDVEKKLCAMDVFVLPSLYEAFPVTLVEAQCSGLPCVVSDFITKEVDITNLIKRVSLSGDSHHWTEIIEQNTDYKRKDNSVMIREKGFDIRTTAKRLQDFYLELQTKSRR